MFCFIGSIIIVSSIYFAFTELDSPIYGFSLIVASIIVIPVIISWGLKRTVLDDQQSVETGYISSQDSIEELLHKQGVTDSVLRPSGFAIIEKKRYDVMSEGSVVEKNTPVKVVKVEANQIFVRPIKAK
ncbi:NfeD family protein [Candidatus Uabimicrobium sp. HlEnr_7]